ncbi:polysaccharide biosynthesis protein [Halobacteriovorax sp. ZH5_bin.2]|uniref:polysaccharide biosynthesis protein n=1 Tax=Halobacteriovorax sp. ZH5_bin.2 TaxID=3157727 RepID=UPI0037180D11
MLSKKIRTDLENLFLERDRFSFNLQNELSYLKDKKILITGVAGTIGSHLLEKLSGFNVIGIDNNEYGVFKLGQKLCDINFKDDLEDLFKKYQFDIIFHAAALKHVPLLEGLKKQAWRTNVEGTRNLIELAKKYQCRDFIFCSTDKACEPVSVMGKSKLAAEELCLSNSEIFSIKVLRFGNIIASSGSVVETFYEHASNGEELIITSSEMERYFITCNEACDFILKSVAYDSGRYFLKQESALKIIDIATKIISYLNSNSVIKIGSIREGEKLCEKFLSANEVGKYVDIDGNIDA